MSTTEYTFEERPRTLKSGKTSVRTYDVWRVNVRTGEATGKPVIRDVTLAQALRIGAALREWNPSTAAEAGHGGR